LITSINLLAFEKKQMSDVGNRIRKAPYLCAFAFPHNREPRKPAQPSGTALNLFSVARPGGAKALDV
jgi:hypothetical protein